MGIGDAVANRIGGVRMPMRGDTTVSGREGRRTRLEVGVVKLTKPRPLRVERQRQRSCQARGRDGLGINERIQGADRT